MGKRCVCITVVSPGWAVGTDIKETHRDKQQQQGIFLHCVCFRQTTLYHVYTRLRLRPLETVDVEILLFINDSTIGTPDNRRLSVSLTTSASQHP